jgi:hypothetical protein
VVVEHHDGGGCVGTHRRGGAELVEDLEEELGAAGLLADGSALLRGRIGSVARALVDVMIDDDYTPAPRCPSSGIIPNLYGAR